MALITQQGDSEEHGPPNEIILSEVLPITYCGEGWSERWRARISLKYDNEGLLEARVLYEYDDEDRLVREEVLWP